MLWHSSNVEGLEWPPHHHCPVRQGGGAETVSAGDGGDEGNNGEGLSGLCQADRNGNTIQILGSDHGGFG